MATKGTGKNGRDDAAPFVEASNDPDGLIDPGAGISVEEQRELLARINGVAEKNRRALSADGRAAKAAKRFKASKNGGAFPAAANLLALLALAGGLFALLTLQGDADARAREGTRVFNDAERATILEIRRETDALLEARDREIAATLAALAEVERLLRELEALGDELSAGLEAERQRLLAEREGLLAALSLARRERAGALGLARAREAALRARMEARHREPADGADRNGADEEGALAELAALADERERAARLDGLIAVLYADLPRSIAGNRFDEAERDIRALREALDAPDFLAVRAMRARRGLYLAAVEALEDMLETYRVTRVAMIEGAPTPDLDAERALREDVARLESELAVAQAAVGAAGARGRDAQALARYRSEAAGLRAANAELASRTNSLQASLDARTLEAQALRSDADELNRQGNALRLELDGEMTANRDLRDANARIGQDLQTRTAELQALRNERGRQVEQFSQELQAIEDQGVLGPALRQQFSQIFGQ